MANVRDRSALAERLADLCEEQGRAEAAKPIAAAMETSLKIISAGTVSRQRTKINFGGEGLPLSELSNVAGMLRGTSSPVTVGRPKVGRNNPCPCGSGTTFKILRVVTPGSVRPAPAKLRTPSITREVNLRKAIY